MLGFYDEIECYIMLKITKDRSAEPKLLFSFLLCPHNTSLLARGGAFASVVTSSDASFLPLFFASLQSHTSLLKRLTTDYQLPTKCSSAERPQVRHSFYLLCSK